MKKRGSVSMRLWTYYNLLDHEDQGSRRVDSQFHSFNTKYKHGSLFKSLTEPVQGGGGGTDYIPIIKLQNFTFFSKYIGAKIVNL